jgi:amino acid adenylation domain-containing protein
MPPSPDDLRFGLHAGFWRSARRHPMRSALEVGGRTYTYSELAAIAASISGAIAGADRATALTVGVLGSRSLSVYAGLLGTLSSGRAVVPLNPGFPVDRTARMIEHAGVRVLVADSASLRHVEDLLAQTGEPMLLILPELDDAAPLARRWPRHRFVGRGELDRIGEPCLPRVEPADWAYVFYTSGSTGNPKGVGVTHANAARFVEMSLERYGELGLGEHDRFSQFYDITFDSSMFDLYVSWAFGACLCVPSVADWVNPNKFIEAAHLSVIDIVPSTGRNMSRAGGWRAGRFARLRLCRFGGEALPLELAAALAAAAPQAVVENVYGPTECTVDAAYYRWAPGWSESECEHGVVPIGAAGPKVTLRVVGTDLREVPPGEEGELVISGPQVTPGYWRDPARTAAAFVELPDGAGRAYRTGDLVRRPRGAGPIAFLGRLDHQIKISGVRVELGEIEQVVRSVSGAEHVVAVGWPVTASGASGIVVFMTGVGAGQTDSIRDQVRERLPQVMVPRAIHAIDEFPLNVNGKVDRRALVVKLDAGLTGDFAGKGLVTER